MKNRKRMRLLRAILLLVAVVCLIPVGQAYYLSFQHKAQEKELKNLLETEEKSGHKSADLSKKADRTCLDKFKTLYSQNSDLTGWLVIAGTGIDDPVVQCEEDTYYLSHNFYKEEDKYGCLYIKGLADVHTPGTNVIIYGHNMKNGSMFGSLKEYRNASYLVEHPMVYIDLEDGTHAYEIFSCYETSANSNTYTIGFASQPDGRYEQFVHTLKNSSAYDTGIEVSKNDRVITLSTCTKRSENRFVVHAKRIY